MGEENNLWNLQRNLAKNRIFSFVFFFGFFFCWIFVFSDNTNPDAATRASYIQIAKSLGVPVRCLVMTTPRPLAEHLNLVRERQTKGVDKRVPDIAYNLYFKKFEAPSTSEGFVSVTQLDWMPDFEDEQAKKLFLQFTE